MILPERKPIALSLRRAKGQFGLVILLDSGYEIAIPLTADQYLDLRDNEGIVLAEPHS